MSGVKNVVHDAKYERCMYRTDSPADSEVRQEMPTYDVVQK